MEKQLYDILNDAQLNIQGTFDRIYATARCIMEADLGEALNKEMYDMMGVIQVLAKSGERASERYLGSALRIVGTSEDVRKVTSNIATNCLNNIKKAEQCE